MNRNKRLKQISVLVVEDDGDTRDLLSILFENEGATVVTAATVPSALQKLNQMEPDVLVVDIGLPEHNGYVFIGRVRALKDPRKRDLPAIALTAYSTPSDRDTALTSGFQKFMSKPFETNALVDAILDVARLKEDAA
jgi:CheY-like chemotaxis protein